MSGMRQKIQYSLALEPVGQGELAGGADRRYRLAIASHAVHADRVLPWPTSGRGARHGDRRGRRTITGRGGRLP